MDRIPRKDVFLWNVIHVKPNFRGLSKLNI
jgi:hypothetical protein